MHHVGAATSELQIAMLLHLAFRSRSNQLDSHSSRSFAMAKPHATLIFSRHGESQWNVDNRFTGWVDALRLNGEIKSLKQMPRVRSVGMSISQ